MTCQTAGGAARISTGVSRDSRGVLSPPSAADASALRHHVRLGCGASPGGANMGSGPETVGRDGTFFVQGPKHTSTQHPVLCLQGKAIPSSFSFSCTHSLSLFPLKSYSPLRYIEQTPCQPPQSMEQATREASALPNRSRIYGFHRPSLPQCRPVLHCSAGSSLPLSFHYSYLSRHPICMAHME